MFERRRVVSCGPTSTAVIYGNCCPNQANLLPTWFAGTPGMAFYRVRASVSGLPSYRTEGRLILHIVNLTNTSRGGRPSMSRFHWALQVSVKLPQGSRGPESTSGLGRIHDSHGERGWLSSCEVDPDTKVSCREATQAQHLTSTRANPCPGLLHP